MSILLKFFLVDYIDKLGILDNVFEYEELNTDNCASLSDCEAEGRFIIIFRNLYQNFFCQIKNTRIINKHGNILNSYNEQIRFSP